MGSLLTTVLTRRSKERESLHRIVAILRGIHESRPEPRDDFLEALHAEFADLPPDERNLRVTCQVLAIHMASQSNLFAAIAWTVCNVAERPQVRDAVLSEVERAEANFGRDWQANPSAVASLEFLEKCYHESIRLAQQSLTLRLVMRPVQIQGYTVVPGCKRRAMLIRVPSHVQRCRLHCNAAVVPQHQRGAAQACRRV